MSQSYPFAGARSPSACRASIPGSQARCAARLLIRPGGSLMAKQVIQSSDARAAIGAYSQAIRVGDTLYMSGQIPLDPKTMQIVEGGIEAQAHQVFRNLRAVAAAAGATLDDIVKLSILMADVGEFAKVNEIMGTYFHPPYPARAARIEVEATAVVPTSALAADAQTGWRETFDQTKGQ